MANLIINPSIEQAKPGYPNAPEGWTLGKLVNGINPTWAIDQYHTGTRSLKIDLTGGVLTPDGVIGGYVHTNTATIDPTKQYKIAAWTMKTGVLPKQDPQATYDLPFLWIVEYLADATTWNWYYRIDLGFGDTGWEYTERIITPKTNTIFMSLQITHTKNVGTIWIDDVLLEEVGGCTNPIGSISF